MTCKTLPWSQAAIPPASGVGGLHALGTCWHSPCKGQRLPVGAASQAGWRGGRAGQAPAFGAGELEEPNAFATWGTDVGAEATWVTAQPCAVIVGHALLHRMGQGHAWALLLRRGEPGATRTW